MARPLRVILGLAVASMAVTGPLACSLYVFSQVNGLGNGADGGDTDGQVTNNGCRDILTNLGACGKCMEDNAGTMADNLCGKNPNSYVLTDMESCATDPSVNNFDCDTFFPKSDASISNADDEAAYASNIRVLVGGACESVCQFCDITYSGCSGKSVKISTATQCGQCIVNDCRDVLVPACRNGQVPRTEIGNCAKDAGDCVGAPDCSDVVNAGADGGYDDASLAIFSCIKTTCSGYCPL